MARFLHSFIAFILRRKRHILLALSWSLGLGAGALTFRYGRNHLASLMPSVFSSRSSIVGYASSALLPFLFSVTAVYFSIPLLLAVVCFIKAFLYAYVSCGVYHCFGNEAWLIHWLLLFADTLSVPLLYLYWQRHISGFRVFHPVSTGVYLTLLLLIIALGYLGITPLMGAISF